MREFTLGELARYDGGSGFPAYVAYRGHVYDVSASFLWRGGRHQATHQAGTELTAALETAPHGSDLIERFPVVGTLVLA